MVDVASFAEAADAMKTGFEMLRSALGLIKDTADVLPDGEKKKAVNAALVEAEDAAKIAEAQIAQALGYQLCRCKFPPTPMLQVGYLSRVSHGEFKPVYECPMCKQNTANPYTFTRAVPE